MSYLSETGAIATRRMAETATVTNEITAMDLAKDAGGFIAGVSIPGIVFSQGSGAKLLTSIGLYAMGAYYQKKQARRAPTRNSWPFFLKVGAALSVVEQILAMIPGSKTNPNNPNK